MATEAVNYFRKKFHIRCLTWVRVSLCVVNVVIFAPFFDFLIYDEGCSDTAVSDCKYDTYVVTVVMVVEYGDNDDDGNDSSQ